MTFLVSPCSDDYLFFNKQFGHNCFIFFVIQTFLIFYAHIEKEQLSAIFILTEGNALDVEIGPMQDDLSLFLWLMY